MGASSVTGVGQGNSNKVTTKELSILANGTVICIAGYAESDGGSNMSPPSYGNSVTFPNPLEGGTDNYVVMLTTQNGGYSYVNEMNEDSDGNFTDFSFITESDCTLMYLVARVGIRPVV